MPNLDLTLIREFISLFLVIGAVLSVVLSRILKKSKNKKLQAAGLKLESAAATALAIRNAATAAIQKAEQFIDYSGTDKKQWAKTYIKEYCISNNIAYSEDVLDRVIEELINFSKQVNATTQKRIEIAESEGI